ncbi:hypothetical protein VDP62_07830 [Xanthomonas campestris pv. campestris]|uniref:5-methylcytosine restriction system specificity protein McrC n=1 Tax=Xanthomonas campestris TaxID=339 RepID=UPI0023677E4D|nr:hypothetical protein [Xanthomonas campestris]MEA0761403.1 hypothetical protein [Xanthomonas campestris pv. campestris]MEB1222678.1 hypothetical protein [Xanthomonas campestris pv. campestris]MEB1243368.1 hypothetical protein [Xanthomonas campestris pv. campestris]MEB1251709.1 hypothetical protein [Xanthomonas campestris pv. campestris]MEB1293104.1 hypothetical protein [Xanthomonas campestris pv. campestris]
MAEIVDCDEFGEITLRLDALVRGGELHLDDRIVQRGYISVALKAGQLCFRATKFVGLFPLNESVWIRVRPRADIYSLSFMLVRSGLIPKAVPEFSRGYTPIFASSAGVERIYVQSLLRSVAKIIRKGLVKEYVDETNAAPGRGRLLVAETVQAYASKGVRYKHRFRSSVLSSNVIKNIAVREALVGTFEWFDRNARRDPVVSQLRQSIAYFRAVPAWHGSKVELMQSISSELRSLPPRLTHYAEPLWISLLLLQSAVPEIAGDGFVKMESLIVDVSMVFEGFVRNVLSDVLAPLGYEVVDGNATTYHLFENSEKYKVQPDIVILRDGIALVVLDAKYKPSISEQDRYEVISFMDALGVQKGGFICPAVGGESYSAIGTTGSGKSLSCIRVDLALARHPDQMQQLRDGVLRILEGDAQP